MNRRRLLAMLPVAPVAAIVSAIPPAAAEPEPIDTRPTFRLSDYIVFDPGQSFVCDLHGVDHHAYTHGCQPVAFSRTTLWGLSGVARFATVDAIPTDVMDACSFSSDLSKPHQHHDFRWVD